jgi:hypothetical protein
MEGLMEKGECGAEVAHPSWLGFIPLRQPRVFDPATRSPAFAGLRYMKPVNEASIGSTHSHVARFVNSGQFAKHPSPPPEPKGAELATPSVTAWAQGFWDYMESPRPAWVEEERLTVTRPVIADYHKRYKHFAIGATMADMDDTSDGEPRDGRH